MKFFTKISPQKNNFGNTRALTMSIAFIFFFTLFPLPFNTRIAQASFFSFLSGLGGDEVNAETTDVGPQSSSYNMELLQASINTDPNHNKSYDAPLLAYNNALVAEIGPQGIVVDLEDKINTEISTYTVREGDSLSMIAEMFNVSVNTIIWANELGSDPVIIKGQNLVILPISGVKYKVKAGDTIRGIVIRFGADLKEVLEYNDITLGTPLRVGDTIIIPEAEIIVSEIAITRKPSSIKDNSLNVPLGYYTRPIVGGRKSQGIHGHNGVDLAAPVGTIIRASAGGKVISSISNGSWNGGYGNLVVISHDNGSQTLYSHTQKNFVSVGDVVEQGEMIAKIGMTGRTTGPHVHFEIRTKGNTYKNPF